MSNILIVDDAKFMRVQMTEMIEKENHTVVAEAVDGTEAIEQYKKTEPDLVTMDITMPEMDGLEAMKKIKEIDPDARIVMCSAMGQENMIVDAVKAGAKDFVVKPFDHQRVMEAIEKALG